MKIESTPFEPGGNGQQNASPNAIATADAALSGVSREFHNVIADVEELLQAASTLSGEELAKAKVRIGASLATMRKSVDAIGGDIVVQARKSAAVADRYVHEEPWMAVGAGAAAGLLVGLLIGRRG